MGQAMAIYAHYTAAEKQVDSFDQALMREITSMAEVVCDEETINAG
ncbi:MAG TPA: hypothetical protein PKJ85_13445 [Nitrosomonas nitrosa]|nr:hypothetical protein [Nitrosomonas nitrosa]